ncbi:MAG TPA: type VII secretion target [Pseudonocardiaceae bacterium]|nr:type VII secretion target [Pseudonocardiaceae bacterium]
MSDAAPGGGGIGYAVTTDSLHTHATSVQQVASTLSEALSAAEQVTMGVQAYGMICGPLFVPIVLAVSAPGLVTLKLAQNAVNTIASNVEQTAKNYETVEQTNAGSLSSIQPD